MSRSPSRSPAIQEAWTTCVALCARAWQRPQCATSVPSRAKWKLRFARCGSIGVNKISMTIAESWLGSLGLHFQHDGSANEKNMLMLGALLWSGASLAAPLLPSQEKPNQFLGREVNVA